MNQPATASQPAATAQTPGAPPPAPPPKRSVWTEKMAKWVLFSVTMALIPLVAAYIIQATRGNTPPWAEIFGRGELLLITAALCARSCGELFTGSAGFQIEKIVAGGAAIGLLLFTAIYFADVSSAVRTAAKIDFQIVTLISLLMYACAIMSGARCIYLSEA